MPNKGLTAGDLIDACYMYAINGKNLTKTDLKREIGRLELDDMFWIPNKCRTYGSDCNKNKNLII